MENDTPESVRSLVDYKYRAVVRKHDGTPVTDWIIFRAQDKAVPTMLEHYITICRGLGAGDAHIMEIHKLKLRVMRYQEETYSKVPDTSPSELEDPADADSP